MTQVEEAQAAETGKGVREAGERIFTQCQCLQVGQVTDLLRQSGQLVAVEEEFCQLRHLHAHSHDIPLSTITDACRRASKNKFTHTHSATFSIQNP